MFNKQMPVNNNKKNIVTGNKRITTIEVILN